MQCALGMRARGAHILHTLVHNRYPISISISSFHLCAFLISTIVFLGHRRLDHTFDHSVHLRLYLYTNTIQGFVPVHKSVGISRCRPHHPSLSSNHRSAMSSPLSLSPLSPTRPCPSRTTSPTSSTETRLAASPCQA